MITPLIMALKANQYRRCLDGAFCASVPEGERDVAVAIHKRVSDGKVPESAILPEGSMDIFIHADMNFSTIAFDTCYTFATDIFIDFLQKLEKREDDVNRLLYFDRLLDIYAR